MINRFNFDAISWLRLKRIHIIAWSIFIFQEVIIVGFFKQSFGSFLNYLVHYCLNISIFYIHALWAMPLIFKKPSHWGWRLAIGSLAELGIFTLFVYVVDIILILKTNILGTNTIESHQTIILGIIWRSLYFMMFATGYYFIKAYFAERKMKEAAEKERLLEAVQREKTAKDLLAAKNAYLKAQINPHFLFNTLDFVYHDVVKHSSASGEAILGLAEIMRFALSGEHHDEFITVSEEIAELEKLIEIHRITSNGRKVIDLDYDEETGSTKIIPLVLLTLAENIFKHADLRRSVGTIRVFRTGDNLHVVTKNKLGIKPQTGGFGSGLLNIKERLSDAYDKKAELEFMREDGCFKVEVTIPIKK